MPDQEIIEVNGGFLRLTRNTWVKAEAIIVIKSRALPEGEEGAEVILRATNVGGGATAYAVWSDWPVATIIGAITDCLASEA